MNTYHLSYRQPFPSEDYMGVAFRKCTAHFKAASDQEAMTVASTILAEEPLTIEYEGQSETWSREGMSLTQAHVLEHTVPYDPNRAIEILKVSEN